MWFDTWSDLARVILVGAAAYVTLVVVIRLAGKRTLSQLNAFDLIVTVAIGSTLATILLSSDVSFAEGALALVLLCALQFAVAFTTSRRSQVRGVVTAEPTVLLRDGVVDHAALRRMRLAESELLQAVRSSGQGDLAEVAAVVLETNGRFSVIPRSRLGQGTALAGLAPPRTPPQG
ncbi:DUF421 domain-containing protein [Agromyces sp. GXS1127]|uniref:DUF421 domain-containing protein n=1 Tax=Agromyces sp. GXS1127 TaxID=3424181 RepID=UPI003D319589